MNPLDIAEQLRDGTCIMITIKAKTPTFPACYRVNYYNAAGQLIAVDTQDGFDEAIHKALAF